MPMPSSVPSDATAARPKAANLDHAAEDDAIGTFRLAPMPRRTGETMQELVFRRLRHAIMTGRFPPGLAVTIRGLAASLGVSAMPIREAMRRLVAERALDLLDNRRARVPALGPDRFAALIDTRVMLETEAASRALPQIDAARLAELRRLDQRANDAHAAGDVERTIEANFAFHHRFYSFGPDDVLLPLIESVWLQIGPFMRLAVRAAQGHYRVDRHAEMLAALACNDRPALRRAVEADVRDGVEPLAVETRAAA